MALFDDMPTFKAEDGTEYVWDAASKTYAPRETGLDERPVRSRAPGGDKDLFSTNQEEHLEQPQNPMQEGYMAHLAAGVGKGWGKGDQIRVNLNDGTQRKLVLQESHYAPEDQGAAHWYADDPQDGTHYCLMPDGTVEVLVGQGAEAGWILAGRIEDSNPQFISDDLPGDTTFPTDWGKEGSLVKTAGVDWIPERTDITEQEVLEAVANLGWSLDDKGDHYAIVTDRGDYAWAYFGELQLEGILVGIGFFGQNVSRMNEVVGQLEGYLGPFISEHDDAYEQHPWMQEDLAEEELLDQEPEGQNWPDTIPDEWPENGHESRVAGPNEAKLQSIQALYDGGASLATIIAQVGSDEETLRLISSRLGVAMQTLRRMAEPPPDSPSKESNRKPNDPLRSQTDKGSFVVASQIARRRSLSVLGDRKLNPQGLAQSVQFSKLPHVTRVERPTLHLSGWFEELTAGAQIQVTSPYGEQEQKTWTATIRERHENGWLAQDELGADLLILPNGKVMVWPSSGSDTWLPWGWVEEDDLPGDLTLPEHWSSTNACTGYQPSLDEDGGPCEECGHNVESHESGVDPRGRSSRTNDGTRSKRHYIPHSTQKILARDTRSLSPWVCEASWVPEILVGPPGVPGNIGWPGVVGRTAEVASPVQTPVMPDLNFVLDHNPEDVTQQGWAASVWSEAHDLVWKTSPEHRGLLEENCFSPSPISWLDAQTFLIEHCNRQMRTVVEAITNATPDQEFQVDSTISWNEMGAQLSHPVTWRIDKVGDETVSKLAGTEEELKARMRPVLNALGNGDTGAGFNVAADAMIAAQQNQDWSKFQALSPIIQEFMHPQDFVDDYAELNRRAAETFDLERLYRTKLNSFSQVTDNLRVMTALTPQAPTPSPSDEFKELRIRGLPTQEAMQLIADKYYGGDVDTAFYEVGRGAQLTDATPPII